MGRNFTECCRNCRTASLRCNVKAMLGASDAMQMMHYKLTIIIIITNVLIARLVHSHQFNQCLGGTHPSKRGLVVNGSLRLHEYLRDPHFRGRRGLVHPRDRLNGQRLRKPRLACSRGGDTNTSCKRCESSTIKNENKLHWNFYGMNSTILSLLPWRNDIQLSLKKCRWFKPFL